MTRQPWKRRRTQSRRRTKHYGDTGLFAPFTAAIKKKDCHKALDELVKTSMRTRPMADNDEIRAATEVFKAVCARK